MRNLSLIIALFVAGTGYSQTFTVGEADYKFPAAVDAEVLPDTATELWARVYWPGTATEVEGDAHPIAIFLHGNHSTCGRGQNPRIDNSNQYTYSGTCPDGYVVTPNHRGYDHIARSLAAKGFIVASINANRGINGGSGSSGDWGLNMARGRLILRHLEKLAKWNTEGGSTEALGVDLKDTMDFTKVGLMGHSRGGEGVLAAHTFYNDQGSAWPARIPNLRIKAIYELAPVDGQTSRQFNAEGVAWVVLLPRCDGDVSDLQGIKVFDRAFKRKTEAAPFPKSTFYVFGANHNYFNTEWQTSDAWGCDGEEKLWDEGAWNSPKQMQIGLESVEGFMLKHVVGLDDARATAIFNPSYAIPEELAAITQYARDFIETPDAASTLRLFDTDEADPTAHVTATGATIAAQSSASPSGSGRKVLNVGSATAADAKLTIRFGAGQPVAVDGYSSLDFSLRASAGAPVMTLTLKFANGAASSPVELSRYAYLSPADNVALTTIRIPLDAFGPLVDKVASLELALAQGTHGFELSTVRASKVPALVNVVDGPRPDFVTAPRVFPTVKTRRLKGAIVNVRAPEFESETAASEVTVATTEGFPTQAELPRLVIDGKEFLVSRYDSADLTHLTFQVPAAHGLTKGSAVEVRYGKANPSLVVELGQW